MQMKGLMPSKLFKEGNLSLLTERILKGENLSKEDRLTTNDLTRIATIYGHLAKKHDLYELLFKKPPQVIEVDKTTLNTRDLTMFTILSHTCARGWYWKYGTMTTERDMCGAVPLAFEGSRRIFNKTYASWICDEDPIRCDIFLPFGLNSMSINPETGIAEKAEKAGLISLMKADNKFTEEHISALRKELPTWKTQQKLKKLKGWDTWNKLSYMMRCMLVQGWIFSQPGISYNMITDPYDWDTPVKKVSMFSGLEPNPSDLEVGYLKFMGNQ